MKASMKVQACTAEADALTFLFAGHTTSFVWR